MFRAYQTSHERHSSSTPHDDDECLRLAKIYIDNRLRAMSFHEIMGADRSTREFLLRDLEENLRAVVSTRHPTLDLGERILSFAGHLKDVGRCPDPIKEIREMHLSLDPDSERRSILSHKIISRVSKWRH